MLSTILTSAAAVAVALSMGACSAPTVRARAPQYGYWMVYGNMFKSKNMTDYAIECVGMWRMTPEVQLTDKKLYIRTRDEIGSVTLRVDDGPAQQRQALESEKDLRAIIISGAMFDQLRMPLTRRLRGDVVSTGGAVQTFEIDVTGMSQAIEKIKAGCPDSPSDPRLVAQTCPPSLMESLLALGATREQIRDSCLALRRPSPYGLPSGDRA
jgi:hypothetical protein